MAISDRFLGKLRPQWAAGKFLCVGLDPELGRFPKDFSLDLSVEERIFSFLAKIVDATRDYAAAYKPNSAFFEAHGSQGFRALERIIVYIHIVAPECVVIYDAKRGDIGNSSKMYAQAAFGHLDADAITVSPYLGRDGIQPFLDWEGRGVIVLARTSNAGAKEFQDLITVDYADIEELHRRAMEDPAEALKIALERMQTAKPLYLRVARAVATWNDHGNVAIVVGATYPAEAKEIRGAVDIPFLIPGVGAQGGDLEAILLAALDGELQGILINVSSGILYATGYGQDFGVAEATAARKYHEQIAAIVASMRGAAV